MTIRDNALGVGIRITGGMAKGRVLRGRLRKGVRPTGARMREAWFSIVGQDLSGVRFLDAFAGSGVMGLEAWSRGAEVVSIEKDRRTAEEIRGHAKELGARVDVHSGDVLRIAPKLGAFDLVFADPPYAMDPVPVMEVLASCSSEIWIEVAADRAMPPIFQTLSLSRSRTFGAARVHLYKEST